MGGGGGGDVGLGAGRELVPGAEELDEVEVAVWLGVPEPVEVVGLEEPPDPVEVVDVDVRPEECVEPAEELLAGVDELEFVEPVAAWVPVGFDC